MGNILHGHRPDHLITKGMHDKVVAAAKLRNGFKSFYLEGSEVTVTHYTLRERAEIRGQF